MAKQMRVQDIKPDSLVYVKNMTKSDFNLTLRDDQEHPVLVIIPRASIPQEITDVVTPEILRKSIAFKRAVSQGILTLVNEEEAEKELATPHARIEFEAIKKKKSIIPSVLAVDPSSPSVMDVVGNMDESLIRDEVRDIVVDETQSTQDRLARLMILHKEEKLNQTEIDFLSSSVEDTAVDIHNWVNDIQAGLLS